MKEIFSKQNQTIKDLKKQKLRNRFLLFLDNPKSIQDAVAAEFVPKTVMLDKARLGEFAFINPKTMQEQGTEIIITSQEVVDMFSDTKTPQGIIGVFEFKPSALQKPSGNFLVLDGLQDPGNVGTLLRSALAFGFRDVYLLDAVAVTNPKIVRSSMSAILRLNVYESSRQDYAKFVSENGLSLIVADMFGMDIAEYEPKQGQHGIVVGSEGDGVSEAIKNLASDVVSIPMQNNLESLNAGVAGSIMMFEINKKLKK